MECQENDSEDQCLNYCRKRYDINFVNDQVKVDFLDIFSDDKQKLTPIVNRMKRVWDLYLSNGSMKKPTSHSNPVCI